MKRIQAGMFGALFVIAISCSSAFSEEVTEAPGTHFPWHFTASVGALDFEGDEELQGGPIGALSVAYKRSDRWSYECSIYLAPELTEQNAGLPGSGSATMVGIAMDGLFHLTRWRQFDPFMTLGIGYSGYSGELADGDKGDIVLRGGLGVAVPLNDRWSVRADVHGMLVDYGGEPNANSMATIGVSWTWHERPPGPTRAERMAAADDDDDGLSFEEESALGTDYLNPDTDGDGVSDGEEVKRGTDPLKKE